MNTSSSYQEDSVPKRAETLLDESRPETQNTVSPIKETEPDHLNSRVQDAPLQTSQDRQDSQLGYTETQGCDSIDYPSKPNTSKPNPRLEASIHSSDRDDSLSRSAKSGAGSGYKYRQEKDMNRSNVSRSLTASDYNREIDVRNKYDSNSKYRTATGTFDIKTGESERANYYSPRFQQIESRRPKVTYDPDLSQSQSRDYSYNKSQELDRSRQNQSYEDTFGGRALQGNLQSIGKYSAIKQQSSPSSATSSMKKGNSFVRRTSASKNNISDIDYDDKLNKSSTLNQTDFNLLSLNDSVLVKKNKAELLELFRAERAKLERVEDRIAHKDKLLKQMKEFHDELYQNFVETKEELEKTCEKNEDLKREIEFQINRNESMKDRIIQLEQKDNVLAKSNAQLKHVDHQTKEMITELRKENESLKDELASLAKKYESKLEAQEEKIKRLEREKNKIYEDKLSVEEKLENLIRTRQNEDPDQERTALRKALNETSLQLKASNQKNDELESRIQALKQYSKDKDKSYLQKLDESVLESRKILEEKLVQAKNDITQHSRSKIQKYKDKIENLKAENENLKLELESRPPLRKLKEAEAKIISLENLLEDFKSQQKDMRKSSTDVGFSKKLVRDIIMEIEVENTGEIVPKLKDIMAQHKLNQKFINRFLELVNQCSPPGFFRGKPGLKEAWQWIKRLMEEYMIMKKAGYGEPADKEIVRLCLDYLVAEDRSEIPDKLKKLIVDNNVMNKLLKKVKLIHGLDWANGFNELDRKLEEEIASRQDDPRYKLSYYKSNNNEN